MMKQFEASNTGMKVRVSTETYGVFLEVGVLDPYGLSENDGYISLSKDEAKELINLLQEAVDSDV